MNRKFLLGQDGIIPIDSISRIWAEGSAGCYNIFCCHRDGGDILIASNIQNYENLQKKLAEIHLRLEQA